MAAPLIDESTIREYIRTFIDGILKRNLESITLAEMREIRAGVVEFLQGRPDRQLGGLYGRAYQFAENQARAIAQGDRENMVTPPLPDDEDDEDDRDIDEVMAGVPFRPRVRAPTSGDDARDDSQGTTGDGRNYSPPKYRFNRMKR